MKTLSNPFQPDGISRAGVATRRLVMALLLCTAGAVIQGAEEDAEKKAAADEEKIQLAEAEDAALRGFVEKLTKLKRQIYTDGMEALVETLAAETGLDAQARTSLESRMDAAVAASMEGWEEKAFTWLAPFVNRSGKNAVREMSRWPVEQIAKSPGVQNVVPPDEQPAWLEHVRRSLTAEQWGLWAAKRARDEEELKARMEEHTAFAADNQRPVMEADTDLLVADICNTLALPEGRVTDLQKLAEESVTVALAEWKRKAMEALMKLDRERREQVISQGGGGSLQIEETLPQAQPKWKDGLAALLTSEERDRLEAALKARKETRLAAIQSAVLLVLDERVALTKNQRESLPPQLAGVAQKLADQMKRYYNLDPSSVAAVMRDMNVDGVRDLLEPSQKADLERMLWQPSRPEPGEDDLKQARESVAPSNEEELEALLSEDLVGRFQRVWENRKAEMKTRLEDLHRQVGLDERQMSELSLAMMGAVQDNQQMVRQQLGTWLRQSMAGVPAEGVRLRLVSLGTASFGNERPPVETAIWKAAMERVLDAEQKRQWQEAQDLRKQILRQTQLKLVCSELSQQLALTPVQARFFEEQIDRVLTEYAADLDEYNGAQRWHLHAHSVLTPVMGVPEAELKKQLSARQMELWLEKTASQVRHYWDGVKRKHDARKKADEAAKPKKEGQP